MKLTDVSCALGAPMGRPNTLPDNREAVGPLQLVRLLWQDGDYDAGGAYWGNTRKNDVYWASGDFEGEDFTTEIFVRGDCFASAWTEVLELCPGALRAEVSGESDEWTADEHAELYPSLTYWASFNRFELRLPGQCVIDCSHGGDCGADVEAWAGRIRELIAADGSRNAPTPELIRDELEEYDAWDAEQLADDQANFERLVWLAACSIGDDAQRDHSQPVKPSPVSA